LPRAKPIAKFGKDSVKSRITVGLKPTAAGR
jgi:hypothetical protein